MPLEKSRPRTESLTLETARVHLRRALLLGITVVACTSGCATTDEEDEELFGSEGAVTSSSACSADSSTKGRCLSPKEVASVLRTVGFPESIVGTMVCTAKYESAFYERNTNKNKNKSIDRGLFQINSIHVGGTRGCPSNGEELFNAEANARCALAVYKGRQRSSTNPRTGISAWEAYKAHRSECDEYRAPTGEAAAARNPAEDEDTAQPDAEVVVTPPPPVTTTPDAGWCRAGTLGRSLPPLGCYQRQSDGVWFQCKDGQWYRGVSEDGWVGPWGDCVESYPLEP